MKKGLIAALVLLVVLAGGWYFASPGYAMMQLRDAAAEGNAEELEERIDFPAVRESMKSQLKAQMLAELQKQKDQGDNPFAALGGMIALGMVDSLLDAVLTPDGMAAMISNGKLNKPGAETEKKNVEWSIERDGLDRFRAQPVVSEGTPVPTAIFKRDGLGWKLVKIDMPEGGMNPQGAGSAE